MPSALIDLSDLAPTVESMFRVFRPGEWLAFSFAHSSHITSDAVEHLGPSDSVHLHDR